MYKDYIDYRVKIGRRLIEYLLQHNFDISATETDDGERGLGEKHTRPRPSWLSSLSFRLPDIAQGRLNASGENVNCKVLLRICAKLLQGRDTGSIRTWSLRDQAELVCPSTH